MWKHMARIVGEVRPQYVFVENSPILTTRGLGVVLADLSSLGFDAKWGVVSAADVGANHLRERIWIRAVCNANDTGLQRNERVRFSSKARHKSQSSRLSWWSTEPDFCRVANGVAARVDRLKAIGNGQVPRVAATAWGLLK
jgi:DNA (cytosine-5)-methyltransferase 1